jgi:hypothetical protein
VTSDDQTPALWWRENMIDSPCGPARRGVEAGDEDRFRRIPSQMK